MSETSVILGLPYIQPAQAQKHVTHNEALRVLDAIVQLSVKDVDQTAPPSSPTQGDRHIVAAGALGDWTGKDLQLAVFEDAGWVFYEPALGWQSYVEATGSVIVWTGTTWQGQSAGSVDFQNVPSLGINTTSDSTNRLSVAADATLLSHAGTDHRLVINKSSETDTASLLFQSTWTGHAEMGLTGGTDFTIKVSPDGTSFVDGVRVNAETGVVSAPQGVTFGASVLDRHEVGTWVPTLSFGGSSAGVSYVASAGLFTRTGNVVVVQARLALASKGTDIGAAVIEGLPWGANLSGVPGTLCFETGGAAINAPTCLIMPDQTVQLRGHTTSGADPLTDANFTNDSIISLTATYLV